MQIAKWVIEVECRLTPEQRKEATEFLAGIGIDFDRCTIIPVNQQTNALIVRIAHSNDVAERLMRGDLSIVEYEDLSHDEPYTEISIPIDTELTGFSLGYNLEHNIVAIRF
jgi:hypothetical protein